MRTYAVVEPIRISLTFISAYFLIDLKVTGVAYSYLIAAVLTSIIFFPPFLHLFKRFSNVKIKISKELTKKLVLFGFPVFLGTIATFTINYIDTIMLSIFTSLDNVGLYQVALPTSQILWIFALAASTVLFPFISELYARNEKKPVEENISFFAHIIFFITIPFAVILFTFPEIIINLLFGYNYISAANPLRILVIGSLFYSFFYLFQNSLIAIGKPSINTKIIFKMSLFNFIFNLFLIPFLGIIGAAITSAASFLIGAVLSYKALKNFVAIKMSFKRFGKIASSAVITVFVIFLIKGLLIMENLWLEAIISLILGFFVYVLLIFTTKAITRQDLKHFKKVGFPLPKWI
jgi:O-antigen/teichoic acid export membrane protein